MKLSEIKNSGPKRDHGSIEDLKQSIAEVGLINPLTVDEAGNLLAGRRRYQALMELYGRDHEPDVRVLPVNGDRLKAFKIAIDENLKRKPLTDPEVAIVIKEYEELRRKLEGEKDTRLTGRDNFGRHIVASEEGWTQDKTAEDLGISRQAVTKAIKIATAIEEYPDLVKKRTGQAILSEYERRKKTTALKINQPQDDNRFELIEGDFTAEHKRLQPESIDAIITDPPYSERYLGLYSTLAEAAKLLLKPGASLLVMTGQSYLPDVLNRLTPHLTYHWVVAYLTPGGQAPQLWQKKVNTFWKPVLWFTKGDYTDDWVGDVIKSAVNDNDKTYHQWGQSESGFTELLKRFTNEGDIVLDPFMGAGTTGVVAVRLGRRFIGIEISVDHVNTARGRIQRELDGPTGKG